MTLESYLVAAFAVTLTGISKSGFAGGLGILGVPLVALTMPPQAAVVLLIPVLIGIDLLSVWRYRKAWQGRIILALLPGALAGILLGMISFARIDPDLLRIAVGIMAIGFVARYLLAAAPSDMLRTGPGRPKILLVSVISGFAGFVAHAGGPPMKGVLLSTGLDKTAFVATNAVFFFVMNLAKAGGYATLGLFSVDSLLNSATLLPFLLLGVGLGFALHARIPQVAFMRIAYALLAVAGVNLLIIGVSSLEVARA